MESRWTWRFLALPGVAWLSLFFLVSFYAVICVAFGNQNTLNEPVPIWNPLDWNVGYVSEVLENIRDGGQYLTVFLRTFAYVGIAIESLAARGLSGRLLRRAPRREVARAHPPPARAPVVDQLPHADAGVDQPPLAGRLGNEGAPLDLDRPALHLVGPARERGRLARGAAAHRDPRAGLRLHPVPDPAALRGARPDRPAPHRGGARPRRAAPSGVPARDAAALDAGHPRRRRPDRPADVRRLLHPRPRLRLAEDVA